MAVLARRPRKLDMALTVALTGQADQIARRLLDEIVLTEGRLVFYREDRDVVSVAHVRHGRQGRPIKRFSRQTFETADESWLAQKISDRLV